MSTMSYRGAMEKNANTIIIVAALLILSAVNTATSATTTTTNNNQPSATTTSTTSATNTSSYIHPMRAAKCILPNGLEHATRAALLQQCLSRNYAQGNETVCYDEIGCFPMDAPWTSLTRPFPSPLHPAEINVQLFCYTRESQERHNVTLWPEIDLEGCNFNSSRRTAFIVHGFSSNGNSSWLSDLKDNYLDVKDANVFLVDWGTGAQLLNYLQVASNTRIVGAELARFLKWLVDQKGVDTEDVHLMGHSLGAHICAYTAKANPGVGRLTAMDPAQPGFEGVDKICRLDKEDAKYVEVLHTNAAPFIPAIGFGLIFPVGHVDFYLNGGLRQPGCQLPNVTNIKSIEDLGKVPVEYISTLVSCSHGRSYEYFTSTLRKNCTIWGKKAGVSRHIANGLTLGYIDPLFPLLKKCDAKSCLPIGFDTPIFPARGVFAAVTSNNYPYCVTDPEVNGRFFREIEETINEQPEATTKIPKIVEAELDQAKDVVEDIGSKGKGVVEGIGGKGKGVVEGIGGNGKGAVEDVGGKSKEAATAAVDKGKEAASAVRGLLGRR